MRFIYFVLCILILCELLRRRIDFLSIAALSFILYSSNCLIGKVWVEQSGYNAYEADIHIHVYYLICTQLFVIYMFLLFRRNNVKFLRGNNSFTRIKQDEKVENKLYWTIILGVSVICIVYTFFCVIGIQSFFSYTPKADVLNKTSLMFGISVWGGLLCFFYNYIKSNKFGIIVSVILILFTVLYGSRAYLASAMIGFLVITSLGWKKRGKENNENVLKSNSKIIIIGSIMFMFLIIYKLVNKEVRAGDTEAISKVLTDASTWRTMFDIAELRIVCADYNWIIEKHFRLPVWDVVARLVSICPFANKVISVEYPIRFSGILQQGMRTTYGLANNFWGECYAMAGNGFVIVMTLLWMGLISKLNDRIKVSKSPFLLTVASYLSFYIHRLDWVQVMGCIKLVFLFFIMKIAFDMVIYKRCIVLLPRVGCNK